MLIKPYKVGSSGDGYVTVDGSAVPNFPQRAIRIKCKGPDSYVVTKGEIPVSVTDVLDEDTLDVVEDQDDPNETDEQIIERIKDRFQILDDMTGAIKAGTVPALIVTGPPGVGKSYGVETVLAKSNIFNAMALRQPKYEVIKGAMTALGLYATLFKYCEQGNVVVFDDCDSILFDDVSLNILKAALDSNKSRRICWNSDSNMLRREGIPNSFEFKSGCIFITNIKFDHVRSKRLKDHLDALQSRCHYLDLALTTEREKVLRIKQIVGDGMLDTYEFSKKEEAEVVDFIVENKKVLREVTLRMVLKVADLRKSFPTTWKKIAMTTCSFGNSKKVFKI